MNKDIINKNSRSQYHGYQQWYGYNELIYRGTYKNNNMIGYQEWHNTYQTRYHIR